MDADCSNDRQPVTLPFDGHAAAHINSAFRGIPYDGPRALATTTREPSSDSHDPDPCANDSSDSSGCPELRYGESLDGPSYFTRDDFFDYNDHIGWVARWDRAKVNDTGDDAG